MSKKREPSLDDYDTQSQPGIRVKQKRKNAHPVRKFFVRSNNTQQKCTFCGWHTVENATRMVQHIVNRCKDAPDNARNEISAAMVDAEERQNQSSFTSHNKKVIHNYFESFENDRKRRCVFCKWTTVLNLTRMRQHVVQNCHSVPPEVQQSFMKQEYMDESECDTYCIIDVDDGDRKGLRLVSSNSLDNTNGRETVEEVVINAEDEYDTNYEETILETITDLPIEETDDGLKLDNETEVEFIVGDEPAEWEEEENAATEDVEYVHVPEGRYYTLGNSIKAEKRSMDANSSKEEEPAAKKLPDVKPVISRPQPNKQAMLSKEEQIRKLRTRFLASKQPAVVKQQPPSPPPPPSAPSNAPNPVKSKIEKPQNDRQQQMRTRTSASAAIVQRILQKRPLEVRKPSATSTPFVTKNRTRQQVRAMLFFIRR